MPDYDCFTPAARLEQIHRAAPRIPDQIGICTEHAEMRERLTGWLPGCGRTRHFPARADCGDAGGNPAQLPAVWTHPGDHCVGGRRRSAATHQHRHPTRHLCPDHRDLRSAYASVRPA